MAGMGTLKLTAGNTATRSQPNLLQRSLLLAGGTMLVIAVCAGVIGYRQKSMTNKRKSAGAVAHIIDTYERRGGSPGQTAEVQDVIVDYEYTVNGRQYRDNVKLSGKTGLLFQKGQEAKSAMNRTIRQRRVVCVRLLVRRLTEFI